MARTTLALRVAITSSRRPLRSSTAIRCPFVDQASLGPCPPQVFSEASRPAGQAEESRNGKTPP